jgi:hypothetical protein
MPLCLVDLVQLAGGRLRLAAMPPLDGELTIVRRIVLDPTLAGPGDLFWCLGTGGCDAELAFLNGALGIVGAASCEPWPGRFCLQVDNPIEALRRLVEGLNHGFFDDAEFALSAGNPRGKESFSDPQELKVLQLCGSTPGAIYRPTCDARSESQSSRRCRRRAA